MHFSIHVTNMCTFTHFDNIGAQPREKRTGGKVGGRERERKEDEEEAKEPVLEHKDKL